MTRYVINVDDDDRDQCPDLPWSATIEGPDGHLIGAGEAGLGVTAGEAVEDALARNAADLSIGEGLPVTADDWNAGYRGD